jgi:hypothetical protein
MSEERMVEVVTAALRDHGIDDEVSAVGEFFPRGHTAGIFAGGTIGNDVGGAFGSVAGDIGSFVGMLGGMKAADAASGLPSRMLVGASATTLYGFASHSRSREPSELVFRVPRDQIDVQVHQRVNVRVLELIDAATGARIELEGSRVPLTHAKDLIDELTQ